MQADLQPDDAVFLRDLVRRESAISLDESKDYLLISRLTSLAKQLGIETVRDLVGQARGGTPGIKGKIVDAMTTNETSFFRDRGPFEALAQVLDGLQRSVKVWSAACSTGQEAYSIAILAKESFPHLDVDIIGTDISQPVVDQANEGIYSQLEMNRGLPSQLLTRYFKPAGRRRWQASDEIKRVVRFRQMNLLSPWTLVTCPDVVFLRNVLIYFDRETKHAIIDRVHALLPADGALFLGSAETIPSSDRWELVRSCGTTFYRKKQ